MLDIQKFIDGLHEWVIKEVVGPLVKRIKALEERAPVPGPQGERGEAGLQGSAGEKGDPGLNGKDGAPGEKGERGEKGASGEHGKDGRDGIDGKDGAPGEHGLQGEKGEPGLNGKDGRDGIDGKSITVEEVRQLLEGEISKWALDFERRAQDTLQRAIDRMPVPEDGKGGIDGKDGAPGRDGVDGLGFDDISVVPDGDRGFVIRFANGSKVKEFAFKMPVTIDRGVYKPEAAYEKGDGVTYGGSFWIAQKDSPETKPGDGPGWRLAVKRGRDGKDLKGDEPV